MLHNLEYTVQFANGKRISRNLALESQGSTLITGRNEAGKSLNLEMIAYSLFGNEALRGKTTDYKKITCKTDITLNGQKYRIERVKSNAKLFRVDGDNDAHEVAVGIKPVNQAIIEVLGFGYAVYRIAHLAAQGDLQALANMKPTERKAMVDTVAGLTQLDEVSKELDIERKELKAKLDGIQSVLVAPVSPTEPETDRDVLTCRETKLVGFIEDLKDYRAVALPPEPAYGELLEPLAMPSEPELYALPIAPTPVAMPNEYSDDNYQQLCAIETQYKTHQTTLSTPLTPPTLSRSDLAAHRAILDMQKRFDEREALQNKGSIACESCGHHNFVAQTLLQDYQDVPDTRPETPYTVAQLNQFEREQDNYDADLPLHQAAQSYLDQFPTILEVIGHWHEAVMLKAEFDRQYAQYLADLERVEVNNAQLQEKHLNYQDKVLKHNNSIEAQNARIEQANAQLKATYEQGVADYQTTQDHIATLKLEVGENLPEQLNQVRADLQAWALFDLQQTQYQTALASYEKQCEVVDALNAQLTDLEHAKKALAQTKLDVKSYLTPALSRVASMLLNEMTGGERNTVLIDEDFEVLVDGQPLRTLSGSGKDIVNLSIRIALGQVLTHKVLPMVCLDEIDQGMDEHRAAWTQACLQRITPSIGQVILVSHRPVTADHKVEL